MTNKYISTCNYHDTIDKHCPVFKLNYILAKAEANETERLLMLLRVNFFILMKLLEYSINYKNTLKRAE
jgi:hypothetical protein